MKAHCGCGKLDLHSSIELPAVEVLRYAEDHAKENRHTVIIQGEIRIQKEKGVVQLRDATRRS